MIVMRGFHEISCVEYSHSRGEMREADRSILNEVTAMATEYPSGTESSAARFVERFLHFNTIILFMALPDSVTIR
jgi:hypothetical protein